MTLDYKEDEILKIEKCMNKPLIGYITPNGKILNYSILIGHPGHDNWRNPATPTFLSYISYIEKGSNVKKLKRLSELLKNKSIYENTKVKGINEIVRRGLDMYSSYNRMTYDEFIQQLNDELEGMQKDIAYCSSFGSSYDEHEMLRYDLLDFFSKAHSNKDFFGTIGRKIYTESKDEYLRMYDKYNWYKEHGADKQLYEECLVMHLMSYMKDIMVQYMGYDSIERAIPKEYLFLFNNLYSESNGYKFSKNPRKITTSCPNPNERFYNWLVMDWEVTRIPKYYFDSETKKFKEESKTLRLYQTEKEEILGEEIKTLRKIFPREERLKYLR